MMRSSTFLTDPRYSRRQILGGLGKGAFLGVAATKSLSFAYPDTAIAAEIGPLQSNARANHTYQIRQKAALFHKKLRHADHPTNGDEELYANRIGSYRKALPQNQRGDVDQNAYNKLIHALTSGYPVYFEQIPLGGAVKLSDPQAALAFDLLGSDSHELEMSAAPRFASAEQASEMVELYWQALTRDVPFAQYDIDPTVNMASDELSRLLEFQGPKSDGKVTPTTIFRGTSSRALAGPYLSQFLWMDVPYPATSISQRIRTAASDIDYMTGYEEWLAIQIGAPAGPATLDTTRRFVRNGRDLAEYIHRDFPYQHFLNACLILLSFGSVAIDPGNPYRQSINQSGFSTFGPPQVFDFLTRVTNAALNCAWYQKWSVHRRTRPEEFGGLVHNHLTRVAHNPIHSQVLNSKAVEEVSNRFGTYLLPLAFAEGCPTHPSYPAGHGTIAGACVTILKAMFDESFVIPNPVVATADGLSLTPYHDTQLQVGGELDKLAYNIALGRDTAGVHWRTDSVEGMKLGEAVAISLLTDMRECFNESFQGFSLTKFDGTTLVI